LPKEERGELQRAKASCNVQHEIATCESFLQRAAQNRNLRKLPATCSTKSQLAKASCNVQREIAACESFLPAAARNRSVRKLPAGGSTKSQRAKASCRRQHGK